MASSTMEESKLPGGYLVTPRVPQGLAAAVEGLTREVIRHSPEDIYVFAAHHFEKLLLIRERCGTENITTKRDGNFRTLREMGQAIRTKEMDPVIARTSGNTSDHVGWSLNQTAKVLKRHRSIFGDTGRRISTDEVFQMANQKENCLRTVKPSAGRDDDPSHVQKKKESRSSQRSTVQNVDDVWKASSSRPERSWSNEGSSEVVSEARLGPRMITQILSLQNSTRLLAKDIKSELRRNRISSRERRNVWAKPDDPSNKDHSDGRTERKASERHGLSKKSSDRHKIVEGDGEKRNRRIVDSTRTSKERQNSQKVLESRALSMDRVKNYVDQRFATTKSLEELQTLNYVEKVQEIIDETGPIIKGKVEELKSGMIGRSKRSSWFSDENNDLAGSRDSRVDISHKNSSRKNSGKRLEATESTTDALVTRLTETQLILENVSSMMARPRRSRSARSFRKSAMTSEHTSSTKDSAEEEARASTSETSNRDNGLERRLSKTRNLLEDISSTLSRPMRRSNSAKSLRRHDDNDDSSDPGSKDVLKTRLDETRKLLEGISATFATPGNKVGSSFGRRNKATGNLTSEEIGSSEHPQNTNKVSLPAVRSSSAKNSSGSVSRHDSGSLVLPAISPEVPRSKKVKEDLVLPVLSPSGTGSSAEESKIDDDVNIFAEEDIPEIPVEDYISELIAEDVFRDSLNVTPDFDSIPQRPDSLEPVENIEAEDIDVITKTDNLEERLQDIQKVGMEIERVLTLKTLANQQQTDNIQSSDAEQPLNEFVESGKIIERTSDDEVVTGNGDSSKVGTKEDLSVGAVDGSTESSKNVEEETFGLIMTTSRNEVSERKEETCEDDEQRMVTTSAFLIPEPSDCTYILTEGSPHEIPDNVTTVIIPERTVSSPESERLNDEFGDLMGVNSPTSCEDPIGRESSVVDEIDGKLMENIDRDVRMTIVGDEEKEVSSRCGSKPSKSSKIDNTDTESTGSASPKKRSNDDDSSPKKKSDPFGEVVEPETVEPDSTEIDLIHDIESRPEAHMSHQDLGRINEEISDELEGLDERNEITKSSRKIIVEETKEQESVESTVSPDSPIIPKLKEEAVVKALEVDDAIKTRETIETLKETNEDGTEKAIESPEGLAIDFEHKNDEVAEAEVDGAVEPPEIMDNVTETKEEVEKVPTISPNGSMTEKDEEDVEITKSLVNKEVQITRTTSPETRNEKELEETSDSPEKSMIGPEKESHEVPTKEFDQSKSQTASDLSPEACRPNFDSDSSNEAKESSEPNSNPFESGKCLTSLYDEESSDTRSPESSNEVKETTLTDGLSLSLDPTRPFVPELNLDSLQDITVSSFKMTEDEYDYHGPGESGKTNSIADTLTFDEHHRMIEGFEFPEEAVLDYVVSSSERSHAEEGAIEQDIEVAVEEPVVKSQVEIKEDICEKTSAYTTGPSYEEDSFADADGNLDEVQPEIPKEEKASDEQEDAAERFTGGSSAEIEAKDQKEDKVDQPESAQSNKDVPKDLTASDGVEHENLSEETRNNSGAESSREQKVESVVASDSKDDGSTGNESNEESASSKLEGEGQINEEGSGSSGEPVGEDPNDEDSKVDDQSAKESERENPSQAIGSFEGGSEEVLEESFVEDDTPLAVSRSASQCTTRRVSSGNLARLREDPNLGWTEETEREIVDEDDESSARVKFSTIDSEIMKKSGSFEIDRSEDFGSSKNSSVDTNENVSKYSRECHIYVPEVDASDDKSTTLSTTDESALTKIQARVRGFLTRKRIHQGQHNRSSTLSSIPSIQDSTVVESYDIEDQQPKVEGQSNEITEDVEVSSATILDVPELENAATRIQSNYRGYKARKRLKRGDAVQRTTLSVEKSFADASGLQHTGEFHDCIALPIHDIKLGKKFATLGDNTSESVSRQSVVNDSSTEVIDQKISKDNCTDVGGSLMAEKIIFGLHSPKVPVIQFGMSPNMSELVDMVVLAKEEAALENSYLNFITSVEDAEEIVPNTDGNSIIPKEFNDSNCSNESLKEPLALSATPVAMVIEEITNSDVERFLNQRSLESSVAGLERAKESIDLPDTQPNASSAESMECPKMEAIVPEAPATQETIDNPSTRDQDVENLVLPAGSLMNKFLISDNLSVLEEKELLGPESSVDSIECPIVGCDDDSSSGSSGELVEQAGTMKKVGEAEIEVRDSCEQEDSSSGSNVIGQVVDNEASNVDQANTSLSFSLTAEDLLGLGSEDCTRPNFGRPILEVKLTPRDIMKSTSLSQESQLAGERMESPVTMVQLAPPRSDSLQLEDRTKDCCEDDESTVKPPIVSDSMEFERK